MDNQQPAFVPSANVQPKVAARPFPSFYNSKKGGEPVVNASPSFGVQ